MKRKIVKFQSYKILMSVMLATAGTIFVSDVFADKKPKTLVEKFSYTVGYQIGQGLKMDGAEVDVSVISQAIKDVLDGKQPAISRTEMQAASNEYKQKAMANRNAKGEIAKKAGEAFLAENKKKPGITVLENGIQYKVIKKGEGKKPKKSDTIVAHYKGTLINGKVFDSSYERKQPATFGISNVIKGWQEILPKMPMGSKWQVFIPSDLAYGARGAGASIGPGETLIFDIELLEIK